MTRRVRAVASVALATTMSAWGCTSDDGSADGGGSGTAPAVQGERCVVRLHGKGGDGGASRRLDDDTVELAPRGNGTGWGGREWRYATSAELAEAVASVTATVDDAACRRVVLVGFSNGASFAARAWCSGETFGGRLAGVVIDDPVADAATDGCAADRAVPAVLYWTGALDDAAPPGTDCASIDWTCAGAIVVGVDAFADAASLEVRASPNTDHVPYTDAPEINRWLAG